MIEFAVVAWVFGQFYSKSHYVRYLIDTQVTTGEPRLLRTTKKIGVQGWDRDREDALGMIRRYEGECLGSDWDAEYLLRAKVI